jgi:hypothetical protein
MKNRISILCPPKQCGKCKRTIAKLRSMIDQNDINAELEVINTLEDLIKYPSWILPSIMVNGKIIAKGFVPDYEDLKKHIL